MADQKVTLSVQVSKKVKDQAQKAAKTLGISVSGIVERLVKDFAGKKGAVHAFVPNKHLQKSISDARAYKDDPAHWSPEFSSAKDAVSYLRAGRKSQ